MRLLRNLELCLRICGVLIPFFIIGTVRSDDIKFLPDQGKITVFKDESKEEIVLEMLDQPAIHSLFDCTEESVEGYIVRSDPPDACGPIVHAPNATSPAGREVSWILLTHKLGCDYMSKAQNAFLAGYDAILVSNVGSNRSEAIGSEDKLDPKLPSFFIGEDSGKILRDRFSYPTSFFVLIEPPDLMLPKMLYYFLRVFWISSIIFFTGFVVYNTIKCAIHFKCCSKAPVDMCAICKTPLPMEEVTDLMSRAHILPCLHKFHAFCTFPYTSRGGMTCPCCRKFFRFDEQDQRKFQKRNYRTKQNPTPANLPCLQPADIHPNSEALILNPEGFEPIKK